MTHVAPRPITADPAIGSIEMGLDWDGHILDCWTVEEWNRATIPDSVDVGEVTYDVVAYTVARVQPDGSAVARIQVRPDTPRRCTGRGAAADAVNG